MNKKCVVLIARAFPPVKAIATERISKLARSFSQEGWRVIVLTIDNQDIKKDFFDDSREDFIKHYNIEVIRTPYHFKETYHIYNSDKTMVSYAKKVIGIFIHKFGIDDSFGWLPEVLKALRKIVAKERVDLIISSGSPFLTFYAPYRIFKEKSIPYVLDFRDLWYAQPHGNRNIFQKFVSKKLEKTFMDQASLVTTISNGAKYKLAQNTESKKINILYNFPDKDYINEILDLKGEAKILDIGIDDSYFNLVYTGTLYEGRDLTSIAKSIQRLDKALQTKIKVHYFGSRGAVANQNFKNFNLSDIVVDHGNVSKKAALSSLFQADLLISVIHNSVLSGDESVQGIITTKIFDYIIVGKPTINIAPKDNETRRLLKKIQTSQVYSYTGEDIDEISYKIKISVENKDNNIKTYDEANLNWHNECVKQLISEVDK